MNAAAASGARPGFARRHRGGLSFLAVLLLLILALILLWDWNWFKRPLQRAVEKNTGRSFVIDGDLDVDLGWNPRVTLDGVRLGNPEWARVPEMFRGERASVVVDLRALIGGRLALPEVSLSAPQIHLESAGIGKNNWQLTDRPAGPKKPDEPDKGLPQIGVLRIDHGELVYFDSVAKTDIKVDVQTRHKASGDQLVLDAKGLLRGVSMKADAVGGALLSLTDTEKAYPFDARFETGRTRGSVKGTVSGLQSFAAARLQLDLRGDTVSDLNGLTGLALPETPPYHVAGLLIREGASWRFNGFTGKVGDSDLGGDITVTYLDARPRFVADLKSRNLDLDDLAGFIGANPETGKGETASVAQRQEAVAEKSDPRLLPDTPINLVSLRSMDADVQFTGLSLKNKDRLLDHLKAHLFLERGVLRLDPLNFGVADGEIKSIMRIDASKDTPAMNANIDFTRINLAKLLPANSTIVASTGLIGGRAKVSGAGKSTAAVLGSLDGELGVALRDGKFSNLLVEGVGLDVAEALRLFIGKDRQVRLRCAVVDLEAKAGVLGPRAFVVDTSDTNIHVEGSMSLLDETLDLSVHPLPKDWSPLSLRSPLHIEGRFKDPKLGLNKKALLRGGTAAVLGALVNPLLALLPLIETGPGKNEDCDALIAAVKRQVPPSAPP